MEQIGKLIGGKVKALRIEKKLSQEELARISGVNRTTISAIETERAESISTGTLAALADALAVPVNYFLS